MKHATFFIIFTATAVPASGGLIAYHAFDDSRIDTSIFEKEFGVGFDGPWKRWGGAPNNTNLILREGSLDYPGLLTSGNHVAGGALNGNWVGLSQDLQERSETTTKYLSFLVRLDGSVGSGFGVMLDGSRADIATGASPASSGRFMIEQFFNIGTSTSDVRIERDETSLLIVKADLREGRDEFTLFINPNVGDAEPGEGIIKSDIDIGELRGIGIGASGQISLDEIRWGDTFADVTPTIMPDVFGDLDQDGLLTAADIDLLVSAFDVAPTETHDLNSDGKIDANDLSVWVTEVANTWFGDANLDGEFDTGDLVAVFQAGQYEDGIAGNSTWATGDWNADGEFDSGDLVSAFQDGGFEASKRMAVAAVPEPSTMAILCLGLLGSGLFRQMR